MSAVARCVVPATRAATAVSACSCARLPFYRGMSMAVTRKNNFGRAREGRGQLFARSCDPPLPAVYKTPAVPAACGNPRSHLRVNGRGGENQRGVRRLRIRLR